MVLLAHSRRPQFLPRRRPSPGWIATCLGSPTATGAASSPPPCIPGGVSVGPLSSCGPSTCAGGLSPAASPFDRRHCNTPTAFDRNDAEPHSSQAGRTVRAGKTACCVTTRPTAKPSRSTPCRRPEASFFGPDPAAAGHAPPPRASRVPPATPDAPVAASLLASDAPAADTRGPDSTAGSTGGPDTSAHTPCEGNSAIPGAGLWRPRLLRRYAATVPWEVTAPLGPPGEDVGKPPRALSH